MGLHVKAHEARGLSAWRSTEVLNLRVSPRSEENLNSTREACIACFQYYILNYCSKFNQYRNPR